MDISNIYPLLVPSNYYSKGTWELPHQQLPDKDFLLTWVIFNAEGSMSYMTKSVYEELTLSHIGWQRQAFENLRQSVAENENFFTHQTLRENGKGVKFLAFIHNDGIGSSRVLLGYELTNAFPNGYYIAFPDRSCGLVIPKDLTKNELSEIKQLVKSMYKNATTPMSGEVHNSREFTLPDAWLAPLDEGYSNLITAEITKLK